MKNKFLRVITSMPVLLPAIVIIPVALSVLTYVASPNNRFDNETYKGHHIEGDVESFKLEKVDKLFKINNYSTWSNYQGGAFYNNFYCLAANNLENLIIYDMKTYKLEEVVSEADTNNSYHCNTIAFGTTFYSRKDKFPLIYISMENSDVHCTNVYRIARRSTNYYLELLQQIVFPAANECGVYLPNSYIDHNNALEADGLELGKPYLYYSGYTQNSYKQADNNKLRFFRFDLPKAPKEGTDYPSTVNLKDQVLDQIKNNKYHDVPSQTATQGGFISDGYLYQSFAFHDDPIMRIVDLNNFTVLYEDHVGPYGYYDEYENIGTYNNRIYAFGIKALSVFEFKFNIDHYS